MGKKTVEISKADLKKLVNKVASIDKKKAKRAEMRIDGFNSHLKKRVREAIRDIWRQSEPRRIALKRVLKENGMSTCEECKNEFPKTTIDHIIPCGSVDSGFLDRMFAPSSGLKSLCADCHSTKTKADNKKLAENKCP